MKSIHQTLQRLAVAALAASAFALQAEAAPIVSVSPATQNLAVGDSSGVDIIVSGLTAPIGGFSFNLAFSNTFLSNLDYVNDPGAKMGAAPFESSFGFSGGTFDAFFVADAAATFAGLAALQGGSFVLTHINFKGAADGFSPLTLSNVRLSMFDGVTTVPDVTSANGSVCVGRCDINPIPEPETYLLFAAGLAALATRRRRTK